MTRSKGLAPAMIATNGRKAMPRQLCVSVSAFALAAALVSQPAAVFANDELIKLSKDPNQWVMPAGDYANTRYSALEQINKGNVKSLQPMWTFSTGVLRGHEGGPLVIGDMMYVHAPFPNTGASCGNTSPSRIRTSSR
jgi:lanthanide-dependent methanol dehydrogenase